MLKLLYYFEKIAAAFHLGEKVPCRVTEKRTGELDELKVNLFDPFKMQV